MTLTVGGQCLFCGGPHGSLSCVRVRVVEFHDTGEQLGRVRRVELAAAEDPPQPAVVVAGPPLRVQTRLTLAAGDDSPPAPPEPEPPGPSIAEPAVGPRLYQPLADEIPVGLADLGELVPPIETAAAPEAAPPAPTLPPLSKVVNGYNRRSLLKVAAALAEGPLESITAVAELAGLTWAATSRTLNRFGEETDRPFFRRGQNGWCLTAVGGETVLPHLAGSHARTTG